MFKKRPEDEVVEVKGVPVGRFLFVLEAGLSVFAFVICYWWPERAASLSSGLALIALLACLNAYAICTRRMVAVSIPRNEAKGVTNR